MQHFASKKPIFNNQNNKIFIGLLNNLQSITIDVCSYNNLDLINNKLIY